MERTTDLDKITDEELVKLIPGEQGLFLYIIKRYKYKLFGYVRRLSNIDSEEVEDILQNIFLKVYINLNAFDGDLKFSSWIYRIAHNEVIDNYRKIKARPQKVQLDMDDDRIKTLAHDFDINKEIDNKHLRDSLNKIIEKLDFKYKEILILKYIDEKDYREISDIIKKPMGTVASRINKAKSELKKELEKNNIKI